MDFINHTLSTIYEDCESNFETHFVFISNTTDDEDELLAIWNKEYSLKDIISPDKFKSYDDLKKRMEEVLELKGVTAGRSTATTLRAPPTIRSRARCARQRRFAGRCEAAFFWSSLQSPTAIRCCC